MTQALEKAFQEASKLPDEEQDRVAQWLLEELADERAWDEKFARSQDALSKLADQALDEIARGEVSDLDPSKM
jgi:hypothetical protein